MSKISRPRQRDPMIQGGERERERDDPYGPVERVRERQREVEELKQWMVMG